MKRVQALLVLFVVPFSVARSQPVQTQPRSSEYARVQERLSKGWNTWDVNSVATQVLLPDGLAIRVGLKHNSSLNSDAFLSEALIGRLNPDAEQVFPGRHAWDGSYTDLRLSWRQHDLSIESAHDADDLVILVKPFPSKTPVLPPTIVFSAGFLWNREGTASKVNGRIEMRGGSNKVSVYLAGNDSGSLNVPVSGPYFAAELTDAVGISTGKPRSVAEIQAILDRQRAAYDRSNAQAGPGASIADAIQTVLGWDTIYEPTFQRVVSPVSRVWSTSWGGYVIFDWDTFFAASMAAIGNRDLAYADAIETLRESTAEGFVPNYARAGGWKSFDRSEPPVGSITILGLYRKFHDRWLLNDAFEPLLAWNRWWAAHRDLQGYLVWGSDAQNRPVNPDDHSVGTLQAAKYESGLDNSPMYDDATYDPATHQMPFADVGLMSLYIADCDALADIADVLEKTSAATEIRGRAATYRKSLESLWDEKSGIFLNKDLRTGAFSHRLSPTNLYPLLAKAPNREQADRMIKEHLLNPAEFWGQWVIPSIARNDQAFKDQDYWRGRIWGPMNYLVYLGLRNYDQQEARRQFAQKSVDLFLQEWKQKGHVHENYNAINGQGDDVANSDRFYHWGALLGLIEYLERTEPTIGSHESR